MSSKTLKEFSKEINFEKNSLKINSHTGKKGKETWEFSDNVIILNNPEQERIYDLLKIPVFRQVSDDSEGHSDADSSLENSHFDEKISLLENQLLEIKSELTV